MLFSPFISYVKIMFLTIGLNTYENDHGVDPRPSMRRHLLEATKAEPEQNSSLILAAESTHRKDPLDGFNYYKGGWNISERHYFSVSLGMPS